MNFIETAFTGQNCNAQFNLNLKFGNLYQFRKETVFLFLYYIQVQGKVRYFGGLDRVMYFALQYCYMIVQRKTVYTNVMPRFKRIFLCWQILKNVNGDFAIPFLKCLSKQPIFQSFGGVHFEFQYFGGDLFFGIFIIYAVFFMFIPK